MVLFKCLLAGSIENAQLSCVFKVPQSLPPLGLSCNGNRRRCLNAAVTMLWQKTIQHVAFNGQQSTWLPRIYSAKRGLIQVLRRCQILITIPPVNYL